jgi:hypothetical protein
MSEAEDVNANVSGNGYYPINANDDKTIDIIVAAEDGVTLKTYTININTTLSNINELEIKNTIIYPNPTKNAFFIKSDHAAKNIEIYNRFGICIKKKNVIKGSGIDVSELLPGIYFIYIYLENYPIIQKLIIC